MATITHPARIDNAELASLIRDWFEARKFETRVLESDGTCAVKARKKSLWRAAIAADRALEVDIRSFGDATEVVVHQGDWTTNLVSNGVWFVATGGMNLAFSGWSVVIQKQLESFIRSQMDDLTLAGV